MLLPGVLTETLEAVEFMDDGEAGEVHFGVGVRDTDRGGVSFEEGGENRYPSLTNVASAEQIPLLLTMVGG